MSEQTKKIILNITKDYTYTLHKSTEEEVRELELMAIGEKPIDYEKFPFFTNLYLCGNDKEIEKFNLREAIPEPDLIRDIALVGDKTIYKQKFKCYAYKKQHIHSNIILHNESRSSFKCAISVIQALWFYITKEENLLCDTYKISKEELTEKFESSLTNEQKEILLNYRPDGQEPISDSNTNTQVHKEGTILGETET